MVTNKGDRSRNLLEIYHLSNYNKFMIPTTHAGVGYYGHNQTFFKQKVTSNTTTMAAHVKLQSLLLWWQK